MPDTLDNILLPANTWVDLYVQSGEDVGTQLIVQNLGAASILLTTKATEPISTTGFNSVAPKYQAINEAGDSGAWAFSPVVDGKLAVRAVL